MGTYKIPGQNNFYFLRKLHFSNFQGHKRVKLFLKVTLLLFTMCRPFYFFERFNSAKNEENDLKKFFGRNFKAKYLENGETFSVVSSLAQKMTRIEKNLYIKSQGGSLNLK